MERGLNCLEFSEREALVFIRTDLGQRAVFDDALLTPCQRRLLRLVNGLTPMDNWIDRLEDFDWHSCVLSLLDRDLVRIVHAE